jgi:hypothetical protein
MLYKTLLLHFGEHAERFRYRTRLRRFEAADAQIDDIECFKTEVCQVIMNGLAELIIRLRFYQHYHRRVLALY